MSGIETILTVIGTAAGVAQSLAQSQAQAQQAKHSAGYIKQQANNEINNANAEANKLRRRGELATGAARAGIAGSGLLLDGSPGEAINQSAAAANLDALSMLWRGQIQANNLRTQAQATNGQGQIGQHKGYFSAGNSLLSGAGVLAKGLRSPYGAGALAGTEASINQPGRPGSGLLGAQGYGMTIPYVRYGI